MSGKPENTGLNWDLTKMGGAIIIDNLTICRTNKLSRIENIGSFIKKEGRVL